jgi:TPP-dependent pyruvate/acetoin dehydrogenase alpha subunit
MDQDRGSRLELMRHFYADMLRIRFFDETIQQVLLPRKLFRGSSHLSVGQEAIAVGVDHAIAADDYVISTHRGHGHALSRGMDPYVMFAEVMGRVDGSSRGKGGSMHLHDLSRGFIGENPVVAANIPIAAGLAWASKLRSEGKIVADYFGDGAANNGAFHEGLNLAALWDLPVLFLCENNLYAISVPLELASAVAEIELRGAAYGMPGRRVNGMDVLAVYDAVTEAARLAREQSKPSFLVFDCYRFLGHHTADKLTYRKPDEARDVFRERDPIHRLERAMIDNHSVSMDETIAIRDSIRAEIDSAFERALQSPFPEPAEALANVYAGGEGA